MNENGNNVGKRFMRLNSLLRRYHMQKVREIGPLGNPLRGQGRVMAILKLKNEINQKDLGYLLDMRNQSLMELLNKLEKSGYITRRPSEEDRRTMIITLTAEGAAVADQIDDERENWESLFACLNDEEKETFTGYLNRIIAELEKQLGGGGADAQFDERFMERAEELREMFGAMPFGRGRGGFSGHGRHPFEGFRDFMRGE